MVTERRGAYSLRVKSGPRTNGNGSTSWATPQVTDLRTDVRKPSERSEAAKKGGCSNLREQVVNRPQTWPTPNATNATKGIRSPEGAAKEVARGKGACLSAADQPKGALNPDWVEWLMGVPSGWTSLYQMPTEHYGWPLEPPIPRVTTGATDRVDRIRLLGNGVVPQTAAEAWETLSKELET